MNPKQVLDSQISASLARCLVSTFLTSYAKRDEFTADRIRVDGAAVAAVVSAPDVTYLQVPVTDQRTDNGEPRIINDATILVRQRNRTVVQPRHLCPSMRPVWPTNAKVKYLAGKLIFSVVSVRFFPLYRLNELTFDLDFSHMYVSWPYIAGD